MTVQLNNNNRDVQKDCKNSTSNFQILFIQTPQMLIFCYIYISLSLSFSLLNYSTVRCRYDGSLSLNISESVLPKNKNFSYIHIYIQIHINIFIYLYLSIHLYICICLHGPVIKIRKWILVQNYYLNLCLDFTISQIVPIMSFILEGNPRSSTGQIYHASSFSLLFYGTDTFKGHRPLMF